MKTEWDKICGMTLANRRPVERAVFSRLPWGTVSDRLGFNWKVLRIQSSWFERAVEP